MQGTSELAINSASLSDGDMDSVAVSPSAQPKSPRPTVSFPGLLPLPAKPEDKQPEIIFPAANVMRIMKRVLPGDAKISKDAVSCVQECACNFISFISSESGVHCLSDKRKTVTGDDIIFALNSLGFDNYGRVLSVFLYKYREATGDNRPQKKAKSEHIVT